MKKRLNCSINALADFCLDYYAAGMYEDVRFGQAVWNKFGQNGPWPELFYEADFEIAANLAYKEIIE